MGRVSERREAARRARNVRKQRFETQAQTAARRKREREEALTAVGRGATEKLTELKKKAEEAIRPSAALVAKENLDDLRRERNQLFTNIKTEKANVKVLQDTLKDRGELLGEGIKNKVRADIAARKKDITQGEKVREDLGKKIKAGASLEERGGTRKVGIFTLPTTEEMTETHKGIARGTIGFLATAPEAVKELTQTALKSPTTAAVGVVKPLFSPKLTQRSEAVGGLLGSFLIPGGKGKGGKGAKGKTLEAIPDAKGKGKFTKIETVGDIGIIEELIPVSGGKKGTQRFKLTQDIATQIKVTELKKKPKVDEAARVLAGKRQTFVDIGEGGLIKLAKQEVPIRPEILDVAVTKRAKQKPSLEGELGKGFGRVEKGGKVVEKRISRGGAEFAETIGQVPGKAEVVVTRLQSGKPFQVETFDLAPKLKTFPELVSTGRVDPLGQPILKIQTRTQPPPPKPTAQRPISTAGLETQLGLTSVLKEKITAERGAFGTPEIKGFDFKILKEKTSIIEQGFGFGPRAKRKVGTLQLPKPPRLIRDVFKEAKSDRPLRGGVELVSAGRVDPLGQPITRLQPFEGKATRLKKEVGKKVKIRSPFEVSLKGLELDISLRKKPVDPKFPARKAKPVIIR